MTDFTLTRCQSSILDLLTRQERSLRDQVSLSPATAPPGILTWLDAMNAHRADLVRGELTVAVVGVMKAGKSTTINAIVGTEVLPSRNRPMTVLPTLVRHVPGRRLPQLRFGHRAPFDEAISLLVGQLRQLRDAGGLDDWLATRGQGFEALVQALLSGRLTQMEAEYIGADEIHAFLSVLNDLVRLAAERGHTIPLDQYSAADRLPVIEVEFHHLPAHRSDLSGGTLTLIDTPGMNEHGQEQLQAIVEQQMKSASAVLLVLDYMQGRSQAEADLLALLRPMAGRSGDRLFVAVNKFDQWGANSQGFDEVRRWVAGTLFDGRLTPEQVHPVSSQWAFLAHRAVRQHDLQEGLPEGREWVEQFGKAAFGMAWEEAVGSEDQVRRAAAVLLQRSRFEPFLAQVIRRCLTWAPRLLMSNLAERMLDFERSLLDQQTGPHRLESEERRHALQIFLESINRGKGARHHVATAQSGVLTVSVDGPSDYREIAAALAAAPPGATVLVWPGTYREHLVIDKPVILTANGGPAEVVLEGEDGPCLVLRTDRAEVRGLAIQGRTGPEQRPSHAVVIERGQPLLDGCQVTSDSLAAVAVVGGASAPVLRNCQILGGVQGGLLFTDGAKGVAGECLFVGNGVAGVLIGGGADPTIRHCRFEPGNERGVLVYAGGKGTVTDCSIELAELAGIDVTEGGAPVVERSLIHHCGGVGVLVQNGGAGRFTACEVMQNRGAGFEIRSGAKPELTGCTMQDGLGTGLLVHTGGLGTVTKCDVRSNALAGVTIKSDANPVLRNCRIFAGTQGGVLITEGGRGLLEDCSIAGNGVAGVAIGDGGDPILRRCRVVDGPQDGLVVFRGGRGRAEECEFAGNHRSGVRLKEYAAPVLQSCRLIRNRLYGLLAEEHTVGELQECHLAQNGEAGALLRTDANPTLKSCEVYENAQDGVRTIQAGRGLLLECHMFQNRRAGVAALKESAPVLRRCLIEDGPAYGLLVSEGACPQVEECNFNLNAEAGILVTSGGDPVVRDCLVQNQKRHGVSVTEAGKGFFERTAIFANADAGLHTAGGGTPTLRRCRLVDGNRYGAKVEAGGKGLLEECDLQGNTLSGLLATGQGAEPVLRRCRVSGNGQFGVQMAETAGGTVQDCEIWENAAAGVGLSTGAKPLTIGCKIHSGRSAGVAVSHAGMGRFEECELFGNDGPAAEISEGSDPVFRRCIVRDKQGVQALRKGKGSFERCEVVRNDTGFIISEESDVKIRYCTIAHNRYRGIYANQGVVTVDNCELSRHGDDGAYLERSSRAIFRSCRIADNTDDGIVGYYAALTLRDCTITDNRANGILLYGERHDISDCFVSRNMYGINPNDGANGRLANCNLLGNSSNNLHGQAGLVVSDVKR